MSDKHNRVLRTALIGVYVAIPLAGALATYQGWLFQSTRPDTQIAVGAVVALVAATMFAEHAGLFETPAGGREVLKGIGYWLGALVWVVAVVRLVPDTRTGVTVLVGPLVALMLGGMFHLSRFMGTFTRFWTAATMIATAVPVAPPTVANQSSLAIPAGGGESTQSGGINIAANTGKMALRLLGGIAGFLVLALVVRGTSYGGVMMWIFYLGAIFLGVMALRSLPNRAPAVSLAPDGISMRRDLSTIRHVPWADIIGIEMKSSMGNTFLVIQVRNANEMIAQRGLFSRWVMNQSLVMFGSPVRIPVGWLKCDPSWLWTTVNEMRTAQTKGRQ